MHGLARCAGKLARVNNEGVGDDPFLKEWHAAWTWLDPKILAQTVRRSAAAGLRSTILNLERFGFEHDYIDIGMRPCRSERVFEKCAGILWRGIVGSAIARRLRAEGFGNLITKTREELDLTRQCAVDRFFERERPQYVFMVAAKVGGIMANQTYGADFIRENLLVQTNVIDAAWRYGVSKLVFLGSSCIYPKFAPQPMKEEYLLKGPLEPTNAPYAIAKIAGIGRRRRIGRSMDSTRSA